MMLFEENNRRYALVDEKVFEFLNPIRGDILLEIALFNRFKNDLKKNNINLEIEDKLYFSIEKDKNLYFLILTPKWLEYYISVGDEKSAKEDVSEFVGFLAGYIIGYKKGLNELCYIF